MLKAGILKGTFGVHPADPKTAVEVRHDQESKADQPADQPPDEETKEAAPDETAETPSR